MTQSVEMIYCMAYTSCPEKEAVKRVFVCHNCGSWT